MITKKIEEIAAFTGQEGTQIKQIFSPIEANNAIRYSIAHCTINPGNKKQKIKVKRQNLFF